jgi:hypothetical protein
MRRLPVDYAAKLLKARTRHDDSGFRPKGGRRALAACPALHSLNGLPAQASLRRRSRNCAKPWKRSFTAKDIELVTGAGGRICCPGARY